MVQSETKVTELKPKAFEIMERLDAGVDIDLFSKTVISIVGDKHHGYPVITGVTRNLFRATANYINHTIFFSCRVAKGAGECLPHATKKIIVYLEKKEMRLFI